MTQPALKKVVPMPEPELHSEAVTDDVVREYERYLEKNRAYYREVENYYKFLVPKGARVLELGCSTGRLLAALEPKSALGIDFDSRAVAIARHLHRDRPGMRFELADVEAYDFEGIEPFDYIILGDLLSNLNDVQRVLTALKPVTRPSTRVVMNFHNNLWRPALAAATAVGRRRPVPNNNWLSLDDVKALLSLSGYDVITAGGRILVPADIPGVATLANQWLAKVPGIDQTCLAWFVVARPLPVARPLTGPEAPSVSIVVPTLDEMGNVEGAFARTEPMGKWSELIFIDGGSSDGTVEEIERCREVYKDKWPRVKLMRQSGKGKGQAVHEAFQAAEGDILMILDSDLTMPPEELPKYYEAITLGRGEFINGCRLVYKMEDQAMRFLNMIANHTFSKLFTYLMGQPVRDTLCGTKVMWREDYQKIWENRSYFGDFDPFGDFDLLFGAAKLNRKLLDLPIRYRARDYGEIKISRWSHGLLLLRMTGIGFQKFKVNS